MNIVVFGATGRTGMITVRKAMEQGHDVTAFVRNPEKMPFRDDQLKVVVGDALEPAVVEEAVRGQDVVICALGAPNLGKHTVLSRCTCNIINAMQKHEVRRLIVMTVLGAHDSWTQLSFFTKMIFIVFLRNLKTDHERQEDIVKASGLEWTIVRPGRLTDGPATGAYAWGTDRAIRAGSIARADVADFMLKQLVEPRWSGRAVAVT